MMDKIGNVKNASWVALKFARTWEMLIILPLRPKTESFKAPVVLVWSLHMPIYVLLIPLVQFIFAKILRFWSFIFYFTYSIVTTMWEL